MEPARRFRAVAKFRHRGGHLRRVPRADALPHRVHVPSRLSRVDEVPCRVRLPRLAVREDREGEEAVPVGLRNRRRRLLVGVGVGHEPGVGGLRARRERDVAADEPAVARRHGDVEADHVLSIGEAVEDAADVGVRLLPDAAHAHVGRGLEVAVLLRPRADEATVRFDRVGEVERQVERLPACVRDRPANRDDIAVERAEDLGRRLQSFGKCAHARDERLADIKCLRPRRREADRLPLHHHRRVEPSEREEFRVARGAAPPLPVDGRTHLVVGSSALPARPFDEHVEVAVRDERRRIAIGRRRTLSAEPSGERIGHECQRETE